MSARPGPRGGYRAERYPYRDPTFFAQRTCSPYGTSVLTGLTYGPFRDRLQFPKVYMLAAGAALWSGDEAQGSLV